MRTIHRRDASRNMARSYTVSLQADLLDGWTVVREWGGSGARGMSRPIGMAVWRQPRPRRSG
jgi:predicted DNA-binding WGR domain protein